MSLKPKLYRDIEIDSAASLSALADAITAAFEFEVDHPFGFYSRLDATYRTSPERYELFADTGEKASDAGSVKQTAVSKAFAKAGKKMLFVFDYGDEWCFHGRTGQARREEARIALSPAAQLLGRRARAVSGRRRLRTGP